jgi:hypothetical protein
MNKIHNTEKQSLLFRERWIRHIHTLQDMIVAALEKPTVELLEDRWSDLNREAVEKRPG